MFLLFFVPEYKFNNPDSLTTSSLPTGEAGSPGGSELMPVLEGNKMKNNNLISVFLLVLFALACQSFTPKRELGLSAHILPKRVADLDETGKMQWGYAVYQTKDLKHCNPQFEQNQLGQMVDF